MVEPKGLVEARETHNKTTGKNRLLGGGWKRGEGSTGEVNGLRSESPTTGNFWNLPSVDLP